MVEKPPQSQEIDLNALCEAAADRCILSPDDSLRELTASAFEDTDAVIKKHRKEKKYFKKLIKGIPSLKAVELKENPIFEKPSKNGLQHNVVYLVLGQVESDQHYILLNLVTGKILKGAYRLEDFIEADASIAILNAHFP